MRVGDGEPVDVESQREGARKTKSTTDDSHAHIYLKNTQHVYLQSPSPQEVLGRDVCKRCEVWLVRNKQLPQSKARVYVMAARRLVLRVLVRRRAQVRWKRQAHRQHTHV